MPVSITAQPAIDSLNAAYRPIIITVTGSNPVVYCDIYFNGTYYKTLSKTQAPYNFDVQNAAQEFSKTFIAPNGGAGIYNAASLMTACYVQVRGSVISPEGFITPDGPIPVQATGSTAATAGGGTRSNEFYVINSALQHSDNQNFAAHLNSYKTGTWSANTYPLTHRVDGYPVARKGSDFFPIVSNIAPTGVRLHYRNRGSSVWQTNDGVVTPECVPVEVQGTPIMPNGTVGEPYSFSFNLTGSGPFTIGGTTKPAWMNVNLSGSTVTISGTPTIPLNANPVSITINNSCGSTTFVDDISTAPGCIAATAGTANLPNAVVGQSYSGTIALTGTAPFTLGTNNAPAGLTWAISGSNATLTGTPTTAATGVTASFTVNNACGSDTYIDTIDVTAAPAAGNINWSYANNSGDDGSMIIRVNGTAMVSVTADQTGVINAPIGATVVVQVSSALTGTATIDIVGPYVNNSTQDHNNNDTFDVVSGAYTITGQSN